MNFHFGHICLGLERGVMREFPTSINKIGNVAHFPTLRVDKLPDDNSHKYRADDKQKDNRKADDPNLNELGTSRADFHNVDKDDNQVDSDANIDEKKEEQKKENFVIDGQFLFDYFPFVALSFAFYCVYDWLLTELTLDRVYPFL